MNSASEGEGRGAQERELGMGEVVKGRYSRGRVLKVRCEILQWCKGVCWGFSTAVIFIMPDAPSSSETAQGIKRLAIARPGTGQNNLSLLRDCALLRCTMPCISQSENILLAYREYASRAMSCGVSPDLVQDGKLQSERVENDK